VLAERPRPPARTRVGALLANREGLLDVGDEGGHDFWGRVANLPRLRLTYRGGVVRVALSQRVVILDAPDLSESDIEAEVNALTTDVLSERYPVSVETKVEAVG
jgi:hypothetical protein